MLVFPAKTSLSAVAANLPRHRAETILTLDDAGLAALFSSGRAPRGGARRRHRGREAGRHAPLLRRAPASLWRQQAYWNAWLARLRDNPSAMPPREEVRQAVIVLTQGTWQVAVAPGPASVGG